MPKLRSGSYFPEWLLERRRRAEQALISVVATSYLLGVSTRRVEKLVAQLGVAQLSKSQVSEMDLPETGRLSSGWSGRCSPGPVPEMTDNVRSVRPSGPLVMEMLMPLVRVKRGPIPGVCCRQATGPR